MPFRSMRRTLPIAVGLALGFIGAVACGPQPAEEVPKTMLGEDNPGTTLTLPTAEPGADLSKLSFDFFDGGVGHISDYQGKPLVVNFFAAWCPPCVKEMPDFEAVHQRFGDKVAFLGLSQDRSTQEAARLVETTGVTYDIAWDPDLEVYNATDSVSMPTTAFVTADGKLADMSPSVLTQEQLTERIEQSLGVSG